MEDHALLRYSRHILLDEIGIEGQTQLQAATVLVVGCGGLGTCAIPFLAGAGVGHLILADFDDVDDSNLQRQIAFSESDVGTPKVEAMARRVKALNATTRLTLLNQRLDYDALCHHMQTADVVLDCCDNFSTRKALNQASVKTRTPLVSGAVVRFEGQLSVYDPRQDNSPCYACLFDGEDASDGACALFGVLSPLVGIVGSMQAAEALKLIMNIGQSPVGKLMLYDALAGSWQTLDFAPNPDCRVCAPKA
ncbi:ThiF family adenylyltransferase [Neisseriaceae bacterium CLB008]|nr:HesA/MoeB/ThiF family protein [Neisseriaceae bacterium]